MQIGEDQSPFGASRLRLLRHYYGDSVRSLFLAAAGIMLVAMPFIYSMTPARIVGLVAIVAVLALFAGLTNPRQYWISVIDTFIAIIGCLFFEFLGAGLYKQNGISFHFLIVQFLAVDFLFAFYYSTKTVRGMKVEDETPVVRPMSKENKDPLGM